MPIAPALSVVLSYLGDHSWSFDEVESALAAETAAQANVCRLPADVLVDDVLVPQPYPADLAEALCRRVAANLANRALPLGLQSSITEVGASFARTGGGDREVRRLEAPYRRLVVG